jgi:hypothetical protein
MASLLLRSQLWADVHAKMSRVNITTIFLCNDDSIREYLKSPELKHCLKLTKHRTSLPPFQSLDSWTGWLVGLKSAFPYRWPTVNAKHVELVDNHKLIEELRRLERRRSRSGKNSIDHPPRLSDALQTPIAGLIWLVLNNEDGGSSGFNPRFHVATTRFLPVHGAPVHIGTTLVAPWAA